jgi:outer membrane lipoprotein-sorting protein
MYFDYADPTPLRVVSDGFWVAVEDSKLKKTQDRYPLSETPLSVLLSDDPDFSDTDYKISTESTQESYLIHASDPQHPERGEITLAFSKDIVALTHWVVTDAQGLKTILNLQNVSLNVPTKNSLFFIDTENGTQR